MIKELGVMINCSQEAVRTIEGLKRLIGHVKLMGYTYIMLYTEDTYEIEDEPFFGYLRGRYSKTEIKEIVEYCQKIDIEVVPCIQTLGHLKTVLQFEAFSDVKNTEDTLLVGCEKTYELIEKMIRTCAECFLSKRINVGMDEAESLALGKYLKLHGQKNGFEVLLYHIKRVAEIAKKYGFEPFMWSDMLFKLARGYYYSLNDDMPLWVIEEFKKTGMNLIFWDYFEDEKLYDSMIKQHERFGAEIWFAGTACNWIGFATSNFHSLEKTRMAINSCEKAGITNFLQTLWGGTRCSDYAVLPTLFFTAEYARGNRDIQSIKQKFNELFEESWDDFMLFDMILPDSIKITDDITSGGFQYLVADPFLSKFDSTITNEGLEAEVYKKYAQKFKNAEMRSKNFKQIFAKHAAYAKVLSLRYNLGVKTRKAYKNKDLVSLKNIVVEFDNTIKAMQEFITIFKQVFFSEMKGHGYCVFDMRFGGVLARLQTCRARLVDYLNKNIERIEELETDVVDYYGNKEFEKRIPADCANFNSLVTVDRL